MFGCPLDSGLKLRELNVQKCKSMDSKMRPLWLVWNNNIPGTVGNESLIMFKSGDDLRQDMLSLQMLHIMDNLWQAAGLDLRLSAYGCLSTGHNEGLIEIVTAATTIANIKKNSQGVMKVVTAAFNKICLYQWLEKCNPTEASMKNAMEEFLLSCAGYCVATYALGVADRHADNIMLRSNGQLFHIDFGHILGHFKSKLGIKRERVPFVLTSDFVYVIKQGKLSNDGNFTRFKEICEKAFLILRQHSNFLIALFLMMMNTGIPEVSSLKDVEYLKDTLVPHLSHEEAIAHFRSKFREALHYNWKADVNNVFHLIRVGSN
jgi:phosphatidylinositol-4,5-bisphosphate 3-kinase